MRNLVINSTESTTQKLNSRITRGLAKELLIILRRPSLENDMRDLDLINEDESVFDTISCQAKDKIARLSDHNFNKDLDEIVLEIEVPNSIDLAYFAKIDLQDGRARIFSNSRFIRKLVFFKDFENELLRRLTRYVNSGADLRISMIEHIRDSQIEIRREVRQGLESLNQRIDLDLQETRNNIQRLENRVDEVESTLTAIQQLLKLITSHLSILLPNRTRKLKVYLGRDNLPFVNLNKSRHYLSEDEAKFAIDHL